VILYLDTSALVKLYVAEAGTERVAGGVERATALVTARITYAEARAAFARHARGGGLGRGELRRVVRHLDEEWGQYSYDAVQLSAAVDLRLGGASGVVFASFDDRLNHAARRERLGLL
jgi:predicted nucleic acid-binding protein